ncbi:MAG TPA: glycosyltransferase family 87 protein [Candidatus Sulfotelmatobacter sp.]|nr:glycosyltransferase family 87 protein [Candidatus Sulfotelmatobacter sp.]
MATHTGHWLTLKRLRAHGAIVALCLWSLYLWTVATPGLRDRNGNLKGTDFLHFYTLGSLASAHRGADLYDINAEAALAAQRVPEAAGIRYLPLYPPQVSICFAPLAHLSYGWALILWWGCSVVTYALCGYSIWRTCPNLHEHAGTVVLLAAAFPAFFHLIAWGQTSAIALACFTLMFFLLRDRREFLAGLVLGCLIFKPQLAFAAVIVFVFVGAWKTLAGAALSAAGQLSLGALYYGTEPLRQWMQMLRNVRTLLPLLEPKPYQTHSLRTFWSMLVDMLVPWPALSLALYVLSAAAVLGLTIACWKRSTVSLPLRYSALLLASVLVAPHLTVYDLVILAPAFLLLADWLLGEPSTPSTRRLGTLLYLVYMLPLLGPLARWTHVQLSVVAMAATLSLIWSISRGSTSSAAASSARIVESS